MPLLQLAGAQRRARWALSFHQIVAPADAKAQAAGAPRSGAGEDAGPGRARPDMRDIPQRFRAPSTIYFPHHRGKMEALPYRESVKMSRLATLLFEPYGAF
ncbi:MAG: hypothetical protein KGJ64_03670 [Betaproteobacteria bacterium]|nr:hypothetical protein [Betaproteobacteria bacterium]